MALDEASYREQPATATLDLQLGYKDAGWTARQFAENLTNVRRMRRTGFREPDLWARRNVYGSLEAPRVLGVEIKRRF